MFGRFRRKKDKPATKPPVNGSSSSDSTNDLLNPANILSPFCPYSPIYHNYDSSPSPSYDSGSSSFDSGSSSSSCGMD